MKLSINRTIKLAVTLLALPVLALVLLNPAASPVNAAAVDNPAPAEVYAAKCKMCHGDKAQKLFDATNKTDDEMVAAILKGKKGEKPPFMPAFEPKGVDAVQAAALLAYMKTLKQ